MGVSLLALVAGCNPEPFLSVSPSSLSFPQEGGSQTVQISANYPWTASVSGYGFSVSPTSGEGNATVTVTAAATSSPDEVTGSVNFQSEGLMASVTLKQEEKKVILVGDVMTIPAEGGTFGVDVQYNTDFTVEIESSAQSWIAFVKTRALTSGKMEFAFAANETTDPRTGKVTVKDKSGKAQPQTLTFEQEPRIVVSSIELDKTEAAMVEGETLTLTATVKPDDATDKTVTWESDNEVVATVKEGTVTAISTGAATVTARSGDKTASCTINVTPSEASRIKSALMRIYDTMGGSQWNIKKKWELQKDLNSWEGVSWDAKNNELKLTFYKFGLQGEFPDVFEDLSACVWFYVNEPGVTGVLPQSFNKLKRLQDLYISFTSMTSLPDVFGGMPLKAVTIGPNELMTGQLPETLGESDYIESLWILQNSFAGTVPESWLRHGNKVEIRHNRFDGLIPDYFYTAKDPGYWINLYINLGDPIGDSNFRITYPYIVKDYDIPGYWPERGLNDVMTGKKIPYGDIISSNKATVVFRWASWCGNSAALLPQLKRMYEKYHDDGLEVIAGPIWGDDEGVRTQKDFLLSKGYDKWYNFSSDDISLSEDAALGYGTPFVNIIDSKGNIIYSCSQNVSDPARNRFGHVAIIDLIPFLEDIFGPMEDEGNYESTDYSQDGSVHLLQEATVGKGINIVFMGDAYTDRDINGSLYWDMMQRSLEAFFAIEPYKSFRDRFNVYYVNVVSKNGRTGGQNSTALGTDFSNGAAGFGSKTIEKCYEYALKVPGIDDARNLLICVMVNSSSLGGITYMDESRQSGVALYSSCSNSTAFEPLLRHEAGGHGFAFLADEYSPSADTVSKEYIDESNRLFNAYGWFANIDFTDDPTKIKWSAFLSDYRYKDEVGIYEGGATFTKGVYRPSMDSMMNTVVEYFNAPSRWAIYKRIMELSGETASFEKFLEYDAVNRGTKASTQAPSSGSARKPHHGAPPVVAR